MARLRLCTLVLILLWSCQRGAGCGQRPLAELISARGEVSRDYRGHEQAWAKAGVGSAFDFGDALRTAKGSLAEVRVGRSGRLWVESESVVRFLDHVAPGEPAVSELKVTQGSATFEALTDPLTLRTRSGTAVLEPGSKLALTPAADADSYRVLMGGATFHQDDGQTIAVAAGQAIAIGIGNVVFDDNAKADAPRAGSSELQAVPGEAPTTPTAAIEPPRNDDTVAASPQPADRQTDAPVEIAVRAGESFEVYDPKPPTGIGFAVPEACERGAELQLQGRQPVRGLTTLALSLPAGSYRYRIRCIGAKPRDEPAASGSIQIRRAEGTRALPKSAPHNTLELDGHSYRLVYQNLRPIVSVSWPGAPEAPAYTLTLEGRNGARRRMELHEPQHVLEPGMLGDGKHVLEMEAHDSAHTRSKATLVNVIYDDSAPVASLELPAALGFAPATPVEIRGIATEGTSVSVDGEPLDLSPRGAFHHSLTTTPDRSVVSIRFQHEAQRVRYYLRRARQTAP